MRRALRRVSLVLALMPAVVLVCLAVDASRGGEE